MQADLRDARLRLLADDLVGLRTALAREVADESAVRERRAVVERELAAARAREAELEAALAADAPPAGPGAGDLVSAVRAGGALPRHRPAGRRAEPAPVRRTPDEATSGRDPEAMEAEAAAGPRAGGGAARGAGRRPGQAGRWRWPQRQALEQRLAAAERALVAAARAVADRREGLAKLGGQVEAVRTRLAAKAEEIERLAAAAAEARERASGAQAEFDALQSEVGALDEGELGLDARHEAAVAAHDRGAGAGPGAHRGGAGGRAGPRDLVRPAGGARARADPQGRRRRAARRRRPAARAARLGGRAADRAAGARGGAGRRARRVADAVAVTSPADAAAALRLLQDDDAGRAGLLVGGPPCPPILVEPTLAERRAMR